MLPSEESDQKACFTYISVHPAQRRRCAIIVVVIGMVFLAVPLITLAFTGHIRDNDGKSSAPTASPVSNAKTGSDSKDDIFRH
jgi:hypothetical protein